MKRIGMMTDVKDWVRQMARQVRNVHVDDVVLVSSATEEGFKELENSLRRYIHPSEPMETSKGP